MTLTHPYALCFAAALACPAVALAGPGKAGLWEVTTSLNFGLGAYRISPQQAEQMRQFGLDLPGIGKPFVVRQCITPAAAARDELPSPQTGDSGCALSSGRHVGNAWQASYACNGSVRGAGQVVVRFKSSERFAGTWDFKGRTAEIPADIEMSNPLSGRWLGADCGSLRTQPNSKPRPVPK